MMSNNVFYDSLGTNLKEFSSGGLTFQNNLAHTTNKNICNCYIN